MNELEHCCDATVNFSPSRRLVLCIKLHPEVNEELVDSTFLLLFALPVTRFFFLSQQQLHSEQFVASQNAGPSPLIYGHF